MKRVVFFNKNLEIGGMEKSLVTLLNCLSSIYDVDLILEEKKGVLLNDLNSNINVKEYKVYNDKIVIIRKIKNFANRLIWFIKNYNKYSFSCNYSTYSFWASKLAQMASKNSCLYCHSNYYYVFKKNKLEYINFFNTHNIKKFKRIIFVSNESMKDFNKIFYKNKYNKYVINNLIDIKNIMKFSKEKTDNLNFSKTNNFIFIGRLDNESKNIDLLLDSFSDAVKVNSNNRLLIVGDGPYYSIIKKYINENKLNKNIILIGERKNPYYLLSKSDCLILTSNYEGFPVVYNEALCLNKKIITTIPVSDSEIEIRDFSCIVNRNKNEISNMINKMNEFKIRKIDIKRINDIRIKKILDLIEEVI